MRIKGGFRARILLGVLLLFLGMEEAFGQSNIRFEQDSPQEEAMWLGRLRRNPTDARSHFYLGRFYEFHHRDRQAAAAFKQATIHNPGWARAFLQLGKMYRRLRRFREAQVALRRAVLLKTDYASAYHFLGLVSIDLRRFDEAATAFLKAYQFDPGWAETYYDRTNFGIHYELGNKAVVLKLVKRIYPRNQRLARLLYKRWARGNAGMQEFYREVAGREKIGETGYQKARESGYQEGRAAGYQKPPETGFLRGLEGHYRR
jgi:tetratricopeptide (TPR) repeat protein